MIGIDLAVPGSDFTAVGIYSKGKLRACITPRGVEYWMPTRDEDPELYEMAEAARAYLQEKKGVLKTPAEWCREYSWPSAWLRDHAQRDG